MTPYGVVNFVNIGSSNCLCIYKMGAVSCRNQCVKVIFMVSQICFRMHRFIYINIYIVFRLKSLQDQDLFNHKMIGNSQKVASPPENLSVSDRGTGPKFRRLIYIILLSAMYLPWKFLKTGFDAGSSWVCMAKGKVLMWCGFRNSIHPIFVGNDCLFMSQIVPLSTQCRAYSTREDLLLYVMWHVSWQPLLEQLSWYPVMLSSLCNSFEDRAPIDFIYGCPIFKWVAETWFSDRAPG